ncbi:MAG TPA: DUF2189 domain-containing protein [Xanthobacteraceae bacterium]|jgi:uncharacterized membrane protein
MAHLHVLMGAESIRSRPVVRTVTLADLKDALARGVADFSAMPSHAVFLCLIYPVVGLVLARLTLGYDVLPLLFPLAAGFALLGPFAAIGFYELSRRREAGLAVSWQDAFDVLRSPSRGAIAALALLLVIIFAIWIAVAQAIYVANFGYEPAASIPHFIQQVFTTPAGHRLIIIGNLVGFLFALLVLSISVVSFPLLLDRDVGAVEAVLTSVRAVAANPVTMAAWGLIVAALLLIGSFPLFFGLAVAVPVLGHATWHLYRKAVEPGSEPHREYPRLSGRRHYAAQFPASLFAGEEERPPGTQR